jgi:hypothetical protein
LLATGKSGILTRSRARHGFDFGLREGWMVIDVAVPSCYTFDLFSSLILRRLLLIPLLFNYLFMAFGEQQMVEPGTFSGHE